MPLTIGTGPNEVPLNGLLGSLAFQNTEGCNLPLLGFLASANPPATPSSGFTLYANSSNALSWVGANGFTRTFDGTTNTANRSYVLPDASGIVLLGDVPSSSLTYRPITDVTANRTLLSTDANRHLRYNSSSNLTLTIPDDATLSLPIGTEISVSRWGTGTVTINQGSASINLRRAGTASVTGHALPASQYGMVMLKKMAANEWGIFL